MTWHIDATTAERYVGRGLDTTQADSVEAHVLACPVCQSLVSSAVEPPLLDAVWSGIVDAIDRPRRTWIERVLARVGMPDTTARLMVATTAARRSYLAAVLLSTALALVAAWSGRDRAFGAFLLLAPLAPLLATAGAFGRWADPAADVVATSPTPWLRLLLTRTVSTVVPAILLTLPAALLVADRGWLAVAWLLPSLALAAGTLALSSWVRAETAAITLAALWLAPPLVLRLPVDELLDLLGPPVQLLSLAFAVSAIALTVVRRPAFDHRER